MYTYWPYRGLNGSENSGTREIEFSNIFIFVRLNAYLRTLFRFDESSF